MTLLYYEINRFYENDNMFVVSYCFSYEISSIHLSLEDSKEDNTRLNSVTYEQIFISSELSIIIFFDNVSVINTSRVTSKLVYI